ncbi:hypothetical protein DL98DRAFT_511220 [Cadophora sp. DSE1049]|nr:hypothetical protein DL98DRAFT_511220 [Cadophora sp. DSE1049]
MRDSRSALSWRRDRRKKEVKEVKGKKEQGQGTVGVCLYLSRGRGRVAKGERVLCRVLKVGPAGQGTSVSGVSYSWESGDPDQAFRVGSGLAAAGGWRKI